MNFIQIIKYVAGNLLLLFFFMLKGYIEASERWERNEDGRSSYGKPSI